MTAIADEVRAWTARSELHPLVRDCRASARGLCMQWWLTEDGGAAFCDRDYGHAGECENRAAERELARMGAALEELSR